MFVIDNIDPKVICYLKAVGWYWSEMDMSFIKNSYSDEEAMEEYRGRLSDRITYATLRDHGLTNQASIIDRKAGMQWLRRRIITSWIFRP
jgi:hypothetical protein